LAATHALAKLANEGVVPTGNEGRFCARGAGVEVFNRLHQRHAALIGNVTTELHSTPTLIFAWFHVLCPSLPMTDVVDDMLFV
jgi:hypothetical protein